jgi:uncharacterized protein YegP (UPF0339 family)
MIVIFKGIDNQWYVRHTSKNGKILCASEGFKSWANALKNIKAMMRLYGATEVKVKDEQKNRNIIVPL